MPNVKAARDQFRIDGDKVHHTPTGAWWSAYAGQAHPSFMSAGHLGDVLENGEEYDQQDVQDMALSILRGR